jgi:hypothetical protein
MCGELTSWSKRAKWWPGKLDPAIFEFDSASADSSSDRKVQAGRWRQNRFGFDFLSAAS